MVSENKANCQTVEINRDPAGGKVVTRDRGQWEGAFPEANLPMEWTLRTHKIWPPLGDVSHLGI